MNRSFLLTKVSQDVWLTNPRVTSSSLLFYESSQPRSQGLFTLFYTDGARSQYKKKREVALGTRLESSFNRNVEVVGLPLIDKDTCLDQKIYIQRNDWFL